MEDEANLLVEQLIRGRELEVREGLYVEDVREETRQFLNDVDLVSNIGGKFPCIRFDDTVVPVALFPREQYPLDLKARRWPTRLYFLEYSDYMLRGWGEEGDETRVFTDVDEARHM